jgi:MinD superfamily P-loop ATPase
MKELVVLSGKGGIGITTMVASCATLTKNKVLVDCLEMKEDMNAIRG